MSINKQNFFDSVRTTFGKLKQSQVDGFNIVIDYWLKSGLTDIRWLAYILATAYHETAHTMQPVKEYGGDAYFIKRYWTNVKIRKELGNLSPQDAVNFSGAGFVQITGRNNFKKMGKILGIDLVNNPELALNPTVAVKILFEGMTTGKSLGGDFTGKHLGNYFNKTANDPINARRIVNGTDQSKKIASHYYKFLAALN